MDGGSDYRRTGGTGAASETIERTAAYCQECGRALEKALVRRTSRGVFCPSCAVQVSDGPGWQQVGTGPVTSRPQRSAPAHSAGTGNPGLAAILGAIPGVGAMYNGQYAKAAMHLVVFVVLLSMADRLNWVFDWLVWGWVFYQIFDAYHTARARRDGLPPPDPFGWTEVSERLEKRAVAPYSPTVPFSPSAAPPPVQPFAAPPASASTDKGMYHENEWESAYASALPDAVKRNYAEPVRPMAENPYTVPYWPTEAVPLAAPVTPEPLRPQASVPTYMSNAPYAPTYAGEAPYVQPFFTGRPPRRSFPLGALWLVGLGVLFLIGNLLPNFHLDARWVVPALLTVAAFWGAYRRLEKARATMAPTQILPGLARALTGPCILLSLAVLLGLDSADVLAIHRSWPLLLVVWGVMLLLQRIAPRPAYDDSLLDCDVPISTPNESQRTGTLGF